MKTFDDFWQAYPRKIGKGAARKSYQRALDLTDGDTLYYGALAYAAAMGKDDPRYTKHPATWLNQESWDDEYRVKYDWGETVYTADKMRQRDQRDKPTLRVVG